MHQTKNRKSIHGDCQDVPLGSESCEFFLSCEISHVDLIQWQCGESYFTKYSSCSSDRAAQGPNTLLNPLHPSVILGPPRSETAAGTPAVETFRAQQGPRHPKRTGCRSSDNAAPGQYCNSRLFRTQPVPNVSVPCQSGPPITQNAPHTSVHKGEIASLMPLSEVGTASRFGDKALAPGRTCDVFEVVLQTKEKSICPACARSPKRARLPAHARGIFASS